MVWKDINKESKVLIDKLKLLSFKISAAESCTGGLLSSAIVNNSGVSDVFESLTDGLEYSFQKSGGKDTEFHLSAFKGEIYSVHTIEEPDAPPPPKPRYTMYGEEIEPQ